MIDYGVFEGYQPDESNPIYREIPTAIFARSSGGVDWYDVQKLFAVGTMKILVRPQDGVIVSADRDVSRLSVPVDLRVVEIDASPETTPDMLRLKRFDAGLVVDPPPFVPTSASKLGLRRAFVEQGKWEQVKAMIAANPDTQEEWDLATEIKRTDPLVQGLSLAMSLQPADVDAILIRAKELVA